MEHCKSWSICFHLLGSLSKRSIRTNAATDLVVRLARACHGSHSQNKLKQGQRPYCVHQRIIHCSMRDAVHKYNGHRRIHLSKKVTLIRTSKATTRRWWCGTITVEKAGKIQCSNRVTLTIFSLNEQEEDVFEQELRSHIYKVTLSHWNRMQECKKCREIERIQFFPEGIDRIVSAVGLSELRWTTSSHKVNDKCGASEVEVTVGAPVLERTRKAA